MRVGYVGDEELLFRLGERVESVRFLDAVETFALEVFDDTSEKAAAAVFDHEARRRDRLKRSRGARSGGSLGDRAQERAIGSHDADRAAFYGAWNSEQRNVCGYLQPVSLVGIVEDIYL